MLLVDDRPEEVRPLGETPRRAGAQVLLATHGDEALRLARELRPSVILLDVNLTCHSRRWERFAAVTVHSRF